MWQRSGDSSFSTFSGGRDGAFEVERALAQINRKAR
jgi:hypothetical protein